MIRKAYGNMQAAQLTPAPKAVACWIASVRSGYSRRDGIGAQEHAGERYCYVATTRVCWSGSTVK